MTEWRSPGDEPGESRAEGAAEPGDPAPPAGRRRHGRQAQLLILAGALAAAAVALLLVVLLTGPSGPAQGSPEAAVDRFAEALRSGASAQVTALSCASARSAVGSGVHGVLGRVTSARRDGGASVSAGVAVARVMLSAGGKHDIGTLALKKESGAWCVAGFVTSPAP